MVEQERQRQPHPQDTRRDLDRGPWRRRLRVRENKLSRGSWLDIGFDLHRL
jgi:hypothetical protein